MDGTGAGHVMIYTSSCAEKAITYTKPRKYKSIEISPSWLKPLDKHHQDRLLASQLR